MSEPLTFVNNTLTTYVYEPFSYTLSNPGAYTLTTSNTPGIPTGYLVNNGSNVVFSTSSNVMGVGTEVFTVTARDGSGTIVATSSNTVNILAGRFVDASGSGYTGRSYTFYKNEPITPLPLVAPFAIAIPTSVPTLPPGLTYVSNVSNRYDISGTPLVNVPQSNYLFIGRGIGSNLGKIVTTQFGLSVSNERVLLDLVGSPIVSPMSIDSAITSRVVTATFPPYPSGGLLRYSWSGLPDGIVITNSNGVVQPGTFIPSDASNTFILTGTPTLAAANAFRDAGITSNVVTVNAVRISPLPQISNSVSFAFGFEETVLFDTTVVPPLYAGVALDPSAISFRAQTYFGSGSAISSMFSPDLRSDLSLTFVGQGRAYLTGTPSNSIGTVSYTIRAINSNAVTRDLLVPITVANDAVYFVSPPTPIDVCYNFVLSRPSSLELTGYYPSTIQFQALADSRNPVTFSAIGLSGTGLSLSNLSANVVQLVGIPTAVTALKNVSIVATATGTLASATQDISLAVLNDVITLSDVPSTSLSFIQNRSITPIQFSAITLSERPVISFTSTTIPSGLSLSPTGLLSGTPLVDTSGSFTINASTGYAIGSRTYSYTLTPDSILFLLNQSSYTYSPGGVVAIDIDAVAYSGFTVSNYQFSNFTPSYGLSIDSSTGLISGTLVDGLPPGPLFPATSCNFYVDATAGTFDASLSATLTSSNPVISRNFLLVHGDIIPGLYVEDSNTLNNWTLNLDGEFTDFRKRNTTVDSNTYLLCTGPYVFRSNNGNLFSETLFPFGAFEQDAAYTLWNVSNSATWYIAGSRTIEFYESYPTRNVYLYKSEDDGQSWDRIETTYGLLATRQSLVTENYYSRNGVAFASNNGVMLLGGGYDANGLYDKSVALRSTDEGSNWTDMITNFLEISTFNVEGNRWVAAGSSAYSLGNNTDSGRVVTIATTLQWSDDQGVTWYDAVGDTPSIGTYVVAYTSNNWLAAGMGADGEEVFSTRFICSSNGRQWSNITFDGSFSQYTETLILPEIGPIWSDESNWRVLFKKRVFDEGLNTYVVSYDIYRHSLSNDLTSNWILDVSGVSPFGSPVGIGNGGLSSFTQSYTRLETGPPTVTLSFNALPSGGPVVTSPIQRSFIVYQYAPITPIVFTATGTGQIYYFADNATLPRGLAFNPLTATLSGTSVVLGDISFTVYVKDDIGVTAVSVRITTIIATVVRQQSGAGAWTSLVRQYTVVNAAQNSVNGRTLPATEPPLGEFMRPDPPDSVSAAGDPNCAKQC